MLVKGATEGDPDRVPIIQNYCERILCTNHDYINTRGIALVQSLQLQTIREHRYYFLYVLMFKCIHGLAPHYLSNDVTMVVDIHGYDTRSYENADLCVPICTKELCKRSFSYKVSMLWKDLKESSPLGLSKSNYRFVIGWYIFEYTRVFLSIDLHTISILLILSLYFYILLKYICIFWILMFVLYFLGWYKSWFCTVLEWFMKSWN